MYEERLHWGSNLRENSVMRRGAKRPPLCHESSYTAMGASWTWDDFWDLTNKIRVRLEKPTLPTHHSRERTVSRLDSWLIGCQSRTTDKTGFLCASRLVTAHLFHAIWNQSSSFEPHHVQNCPRFALTSFGIRPRSLIRETSKESPWKSPPAAKLANIVHGANRTLLSLPLYTSCFVSLSCPM